MALDLASPSARPMPQALGEYLISARIVPPVVIDYVLQKQKIEGVPMGSLLVDLGLVSPKEIARYLAQQRGIPFVEVSELPVVEGEVASVFNRNLCLTHGFLPLRRDGDVLEVVLGDAQPAEVMAVVQRRMGLGVRFLQGEFQKVAQSIHQHYYFAENPADRLIESEIRRLEADVDRAYSPARLLELILHLAVRERATDIHLAPTAKSRTVLMRVDGVMRPMFALAPSLDRLVSYVKLQADMDASEQRLPQDGSFTADVLEAAYTIRVSTLISEFGERMVMRLLPERSDLDKLQDLGFLPEDVAVMEKVFSRPHGLILITGPTGSGKSTTLHAALRMQPLIERNVLTVEDPIEYRVPVACQTEVNRRAGYEFASAMRHFLRHDPDIILVGEIRDPETARAALDASSTGHLVLSTLHVGGIFGVVPRLKLLGVDTETIAENLITVINQRLVRRICPHCRTARHATAEEHRWLGGHEVPQVYYGAGCTHCRDTGFFGRLPVYELLLINREVADAIASDVSRRELRELAEAAGLRPIVTLARQRVLAGETTMDEILRTVGEH
ncbi:Flp pilus assembly complex ATPase component TadA [Acidovorax sp. DW039]|uniref:GspE/PulE family protein n=1 Tax=Acidovorax sp. DW039 TaxID=3095606 RepID=UPI003088F6DD|nr:Flp pilus assembly complex ATPase component TadA [Acidovorax sp. DW039]